MLCGRLVTGLAALVVSAVGAAGAPPACYVKKATWIETVVASREALLRSEADAAAKRSAGDTAEPGAKRVQPVRVVIPYRGRGQRIRVDVSGVQTVYFGSFSTGGLRGRLQNVRLIHKEGMPVPAELKAPLVSKVTGRKSLRGSKSRNRVQYDIDDTELTLALKGEYKSLEMNVSTTGRGRGGEKVAFWVTPAPSLATQKQAVATRDALWLAVASDFTSADQQDEIAQEKSFWATDWAPGDLSSVAKQYASRTSSQLRARAGKLAEKAKALDDVLKVRAVYQLGKRVDRAVAQLGEINFEALRRAVQDLTQTFGDRYPKGAEYLRRLDACEKALPQILKDVSGGDTAAMAKANEALALQRQALLSNPLLDFDKILLVKRGLGNLGLVNNWLSNSSAAKTGYDNEIAVLSPIGPEGKLTTLYRPEGGSFVGDVDLDFDAEKMLFSMPVGGRWGVYEIRADGQGLHQVTPADQKDVDAYDACYLPDGRVVFTSTANMQGVPCIGGGGHVANLAILDPKDKAKKVRMLCFEQDHDWCPTVTNDGHVMYLRWEYTDTPHYYTRVLFTMNPDGTNQRAHYGTNSYWPNALFFARPIPNHPTRFVGIIGGHHDVRRMGEMIVFDPAVGHIEADGAIQRIPGYGQKVQPIIKDGLVGGSWPQFLHPYPLSEKYFLVSRRIRRDRSAPWGIYLVDVFDNMLLLKAVDGYALFEPLPFRKTPRPPVIPDKVDLARTDALVYLANVYAGPGLKGIPRGKVKKLRLFTYTFGYRGMGGHNCFGVESGWDAKRILGTVPVEKDGSAFFRVPANTPISLQPLDENNAALQLMRSWLTAMPGETLACVGCHENEGDTVVNYQTHATARKPSPIEPWRGPARGIGFPREVQPVLDKYCAGCHDGKKKHLPNFAETKGTWRGYARSYHDLAKYIRRPGPESDYHLLAPMAFHVSTSPVIQKLARGHHNVQLDAEAQDRLHTWIDLNVPYNATWGEFRRGRLGNVAKRFRDLQKLYANLDVDPEKLPPLPTERPKPVMPKPEPVAKIAVPTVPGWPFDAGEARKRQADALGRISAAAPARATGPAGPTQGGPAKPDAKGVRTISLGMMPETRHPITCKPIPPMPVELKLTLIPAGEFALGDAHGEADERATTRVRIDKPFWMGVVEITNAQYAIFDATHDSRFIDMELKDQAVPGYQANKPDQPVIRVSWQEAMAFCKWLSDKTGKRFSLPTEAQWEWACRAGTAGPMWFGDAKTDFSPFANLSDVNVKKFALERFRPRIAKNPVPEHAFIPKVESVDDKHQIAAPVGTYKPNPWGLCDMHGNVAEWTLSTYKAYPYKADDGRNAPAPAGKKVTRGGSWFDRPCHATSASRLPYESYQKVFNVGFRVIMAAE